MEGKIITLKRSRIDTAIEIFKDAFYGDPLFEYIFAPSINDYTACLWELFRFSCEVRYLLDWPILGLEDNQDKMVGAASVNLPGDAQWPQALKDIYQQYKDFIGPEAAKRFNRMAALADPLSPPQPFHELGVLGVLSEEHGHGYGGKLVRAVNDMSEKHPKSTGVYLYTQNQQNVGYYESFGYQVTGKRVFSEEDQIYLWGMFKPNK